MTSMLPDEIAGSPEPVTPTSMASEDNTLGANPKLKTRQRLLNGLHRIASSPSLTRMGRPRASSLGSRRVGKGSMSCVSLNSPTYGQCFADGTTPHLRGPLSRPPAVPSNTPVPQDDHDIPIRLVGAEQPTLNPAGQTSIRVPSDIRPSSRGTPLEATKATEIVNQKQRNIRFWDDTPVEIRMEILRYLTPKEMVRCSRVSKSWNKMCFDGQLWANLDVSAYYRDITVEALVKIIVAAGPFLRDLNLRGCIQLKNAWPSEADRISSVCRNLVNICVEDCRIDRSALHLLLVRNPSLVHVDMAALTTTVTNATVKILARSCPNVEFLDVSFCKRVNSRALRYVVASCPKLRDLRVGHLGGFDNQDLMLEIFKANTLERLILANCATLTDASLKALVHGEDPEIDVLTDLPIVPPRKLKHLDLSRCRGLSEAGIKALAHNVPDLEGLQLSHCTHLGDDAILEVLRTTPLLTHLDLEELENLTNNFLIELSKAPCAANLEHLNLSYCDKLGDAGLLPLLKSCPNLRSLDIDNTRVSDLSMMEICNQARKRGYGNTLPKFGMRVAVFDCGNVTWAGIREVLYNNSHVPRFAGADLSKTPDQSFSPLSSSSFSSLSPSESSSGTCTPVALPSPAPPLEIPLAIYPNEIVQLKCFYGFQMTVDEHTKRVLRGDLASAIRLERKWADFMISTEEAGTGGAGVRRRRRRAREAEMLFNADDDDEGTYGPAGLAPLGRRRRARSGGNCVVM
ncbi:hypothetical protein AJ80_07063 [Polytolypa hystricis UAMH7299]|uniref:F-box domain-containing protein n=1 Tax=Polytolypa hystricis (strain UAMH7299) TaxID=1447883 RepID=A0A2B7XS50_POLH7|nr:hypothetical protein AJ80_07063 [Polytolypa hystricis UAMH7299]